MQQTPPWWHENREPVAARRKTSVIVAIYAVVCIVLLGLSYAFGREVAVGDSLAVGFGQASGMPTRAIVGISSCRVAGLVPAGHFDFVLVSAGTNDPPGRCVEQVRDRIDADLVEWVVPVNGARGHVLAVATAHGDRTLFYAGCGGNVHPCAYFNVHGGVRLHRELLTPDGRLPGHRHYKHRQHRRKHR